MKKFWVFLCAMFICGAYATTVNIEWLSDGQTYAQTTCETGGNFTLPSPTPTKYGYHFVGWQQSDVIGSWSQIGTPSPTNPIEPTFTQFGHTVLRAVGTGDNLIADSYDSVMGKIIRRVGVGILNGTEALTVFSAYIKSDATDAFIIFDNMDTSTPTNSLLCSQLKNVSGAIWSTQGLVNTCTKNTNQIHLNISNDVLGITDYTQETTTTAKAKIKAFITNQYENGTPVTLYYPLATPVEEDY